MTTLQHIPVHPASTDPESVFDRDRFLLRQKLVAISQKYTVSDESGEPIIHVVRPAYAVRAGLILLMTLVLFILVIVGAFALSSLLPRSGMQSHPLEPLVFLMTVLVGMGACVFLAVLLYPKRHIYFYLDKERQHQILHIQQRSKWELITASYTVISRDGEPLAVLRKNYLWNFIRRRWRVLDPDGAFIALALEDSMLKSILRRSLGAIGAMIRTNFIIQTPTGERIGAFDRKFTILDKYVLDLTEDREALLDRRVALALGVMLDTGERR